MLPQDILSEAIERLALQSLHEHCPPATREELGLFLEEVGDVLVAGARNDPSILLNRALGLGTARPVERATIEAVQATYARHGVERYFFHVYPETLPEGGDVFATRAESDTLPKLCKARGWMKFARDSRPPMERSTTLRIERATDSVSAGHYGGIVARAFGMTSAAAPLLAGLVSDPRWHGYVSYADDAPAGAGALFVDTPPGADEPVGWFEWASTDRAFRRLGSQGAIMTQRIRTALELGCRVMFTETGEAVKGEAQHSYGNIERFGFEASVLRENWAPEVYLATRTGA